MAHPVDDKSLESVLSDCGVSSGISAQLIAENWTAETFAFCVSSIEEFSPAFFSELVPGEEVGALQRAALRLAWKKCHQAWKSGSPPLLPTGSSSASPALATTDTSWSESFAPKLNSDKIKSLKLAFLQKYPSEILSTENMPSTRLLSLVAHQTAKKHWSWVPWKFRLSVSRAEDIAASRSSKAPKLEGLTLHTLLMDEPPALEVSNSGMGVNAIRNLLDLHNTALAMCNCAHLANLKAYTSKFLTYLTQRLDPESGLRCATVLEAQAADKHVWSVISELMNEREWAMDDALHEMTHLRADLSLYLQPRLRTPKVTIWQPSKGKGRSDDQAKGKSKSKGKSKALTSKGGKQSRLSGSPTFSTKASGLRCACDTNPASVPALIASSHTDARIHSPTGPPVERSTQPLITAPHPTDSVQFILHQGNLSHRPSRCRRPAISRRRAASWRLSFTSQRPLCMNRTSIRHHQIRRAIVPVSLFHQKPRESQGLLLTKPPRN